MEHLLPVLLPTAVSGLIMMGIQSRYPPSESTWIVAGWVAHFFGLFANLFVVFYVYGFGDMLGFIRAGTEIAAYCRFDPSHLIDVFRLVLQFETDFIQGGSDSTGTMDGLAALLCLLLNDSVWGVSMAACMISFFGKLALYQALRDSFSPHHRRYLLIATLLVPSVVFWSAGLIKEAMAIAGVGFGCYGVSLVVKRRYWGVGLALGGLYFAAMVKPHVLLATVVATAALLYWTRAVRRGTVEIRPISMVFGIAVAAIGVLAVGEVFPRFALENLVEETAKLQASGNRGGSGFSLGASDASLVSQIALAPIGLFTGLFRPSLLDAHNAQAAVNGLETTLFLFLTLRAAVTLRYKGFIDLLVRYPVLVYCLAFTFVMALGVGLASANLGTLSRYRMPLVPFFVVLLAVANSPNAPERRAIKKKNPSWVRPIDRVQRAPRSA